ncbi:LacI family DNA-binding transcriptional regulator [Actinomadura sp. CNU-125]|uniref:LacI family DNA-binding transcriptional regulator n=1 Tax=Actinomadura sp. CNU-125 TaxID=1904961 RepID=UPI0009FA0831|nr:LacI family DNA-binding transcriptional regulator [Actinomadura sp. CNU-125]
MKRDVLPWDDVGEIGVPATRDHDATCQRPTSSDVARAAGVSQTTVSFVLNNRPGQSIPEETRRRVLDAARRLDYRPHASARALAAGRSDIVLLSIPDLPIGQGISRFVEGLAAALADHGLTLVTHLAGVRGRPLATCAPRSAPPPSSVSTPSTPTPSRRCTGREPTWSCRPSPRAPR